jgi:branched-chain amino acid transport system substrate-binding protein
MPTSSEHKEGMLPADVSWIQQTIAFYYQSLEKLEARAAQYGPLDVPLYLENQIEEVKKRINELEGRLAGRSETTQAEQLFSRGFEAYYRGDIGEAARYLEMTLEISPYHPRAKELLEEVEGARSRPLAYSWVKTIRMGRQARWLMWVGVLLLIVLGVFGYYQAQVQNQNREATAAAEKATPTLWPTLSPVAEIFDVPTRTATLTPTEMATLTPTEMATPTAAAVEATRAVVATAPAEARGTGEAAMTSGCDDPWGCVVIAPGEPLKMAVALALGGPTESIGADSQIGIEVASQEQGELFGHPIEVVAEDGDCSAEGGYNAASKIAANPDIVAVVGDSCSSACRAAAPIYDEAGLTMVSPSCTAPDLTAEGSHVESFLRTAPNDARQGGAMAEFAYNELGVRTAATIHDGSPYAERLQQEFAERFSELGGTITAQEEILAGDIDMRPVLTAIGSERPELLYYPVFITEGSFITSQVKEVAGLEDSILAGADGLMAADFIAAAGEASEGMYFSSPILAFGGERYDKFKAVYEEIAGQEPFSVFHAHAYDATKMIFEAIEKVAKQDADGNTIIGRQALREALYGTQDFEGLTGKLTCNALGDCGDLRIEIYQIQNGEYAPVYQSGQ